MNGSATSTARTGHFGMRLWTLGLALVFSGCTCGSVHVSELLQRMESQPKYVPYSQNDLFADGRAMRTPPEGTVSREQPAGNFALTRGLVNGQLVTSFPLPVTPELLARGKRKFEIVCATCHGILGNGDSIVADNMATRLPPSLVALQDRSVGFFYQAIALGYGLMPSFAGEIPVEERWAVIAYIRALQLSQNAPMSKLSSEERTKVMEDPSWSR